MRRRAVFFAMTLSAFSLYTPLARAEYRAYLLSIVNQKTKQARLVKSVFDHIQYPDYYPVGADEQVSIQDTWMCWGRQGELIPICPNPRATAPPPPTASGSSSQTRLPASSPSAQ